MPFIMLLYLSTLSGMVTSDQSISNILVRLGETQIPGRGARTDKDVDDGRHVGTKGVLVGVKNLVAAEGLISAPRTRVPQVGRTDPGRRRARRRRGTSGRCWRPRY